MRVLVTGASGQLGHDVCRELDRRKIEHRGVSSRELDIRDGGAVSATVEAYRPDAVIHCAAYTRVDLAEDEPALCWAVNADGTRNIAAACGKTGAKLLYISTDYVFPGTGERFYRPEDSVNPQNVYGASKLAGELAVKALLTGFFIVRISWVFGKNGSNFVKTMLRLAETRTEVNVVCDQMGSPTYTADLAPLLCDMVRTDRFGVYHAANGGVCSWAELAEEIFRAAGKSVAVNRIPAAEYPARAKRPLNSRLDQRRLQEQGFSPLPPWRDALARYLSEIKGASEL